MLVDIVSKNGNLLLNIPVRGDGSIDEKELAVVEGITAWMDVNSECIYGTRPWEIYGEGPKAESVNPINAQGFNEGKGAPYTSADIRFTKKGDVLYAIIMDQPENNEMLIKSLAVNGLYYSEKYKNVAVLVSEPAAYSFSEKGLQVKFRDDFKPDMPVVLKIY